MSINALFRHQSVRADYKGTNARIVGITSDVDGAVKNANIADGNILLAYKQETEVDGVKGTETLTKRFSTDGGIPGLSVKLPRNDGGFDQISMSTPRDGVLALLKAEKAHREDMERVAKLNEEAQKEYEAARERGDNPAEPEEILSRLKTDAFENISTIVKAVKEGNVKQLDARLTTQDVKADIEVFLKKAQELEGSSLTNAQLALAKEYRTLRGELGMLKPDHDLALKTIAKKSYEGDLEAMAEFAATLPHDYSAQSAAMKSPISRTMDRDLVAKLFAVATTLPVEKMVGNGGQKVLSHASFVALNDDLARNFNAAATQAICARMQAVTASASEHYAWEGRIFTKDGMDILVMRDRQAAWAYVWPADSRIADIDVASVLDGALTAEDVPTEEQMEAIKALLEEARYDVGEVDFDWADEFGDLVEDEVDFGLDD